MGKSSERVTVAQAAKELGVSQQFIRICMQRGELPIGICTKLTGDKYTYLITRSRLDAYKNGCDIMKPQQEGDQYEKL